MVGGISMHITVYSIRAASKEKLEDMFNYLSSQVALTDKEIYYQEMIARRLKDIHNKEVKK